MTGDIPTCSVRPYEPQDLTDIGVVLGRIGWAEQFVEGQLSSIQAFAANINHARVYVASALDHVVGFSTVLFESWNRLGQIHGLVVDPQWRRHGLAARLILKAETFVRELGGRGIFVDTPINNDGGRRFYEALGYTHDYTMTEYYDKGLDGVTYVKFFKEVDAKQ
jgi:ribosomal protein S18 acetylase RimI-like enzyme